MSYFSVDYTVMAQAMQTEEELRKRFDSVLQRLLKCSAKAASIGSLRNKDYHGKIWQVYSGAVRRQSEIYRMYQGLAKSSDTYREYEMKVLSQTGDIMTAKNGFSEKSVKKVKAAVKDYKKYAAAHELAKDKTFGNILYDATVGQWAKSWNDCKDAVKFIKETRDDIGKNWSDNFDFWLKEQGLDGPLLGALVTGKNKLMKKADNLFSTSEDIILGILDFPDMESFKDGAVSVLSLMTGKTALEGIDEAAGSAFSVLLPESGARQLYDNISGRAAEAFKAGDYLEGIGIYLGGSAESIAVGLGDAAADYIGGQADSFIKKASTLMTGEESGIVDVLNGAESMLNEAAVWLYT